VLAVLTVPAPQFNAPPTRLKRFGPADCTADICIPAPATPKSLLRYPLCTLQPIPRGLLISLLQACALPLRLAAAAAAAEALPHTQAVLGAREVRVLAQLATLGAVAALATAVHMMMMMLLLLQKMVLPVLSSLHTLAVAALATVVHRLLLLLQKMLLSVLQPLLLLTIIAGVLCLLLL